MPGIEISTSKLVGMRPGWSIGSILRFYSCLYLIGGLRLPRNTYGFLQFGHKGPHLLFVRCLREVYDCGAIKSVGVRRTQRSDALGCFLSVDSELGEFGSSGRNRRLISSHGRDVNSSNEADEKGKERRIDKPERVDWVVPLDVNRNDVEYSAEVTRNEGSTTVIEDQFDGVSPVLGHQDVDGKKLFLYAGGEEEKKKCDAGTAVFYNASSVNQEVSSLTRRVLREDRMDEEQRRADSNHHENDTLNTNDGGSAPSFSVMHPVGKDVGFLDDKSADTPIKSEILRNRAILMQAKANDLQESVSRIMRVLSDHHSSSEHNGLKEDTWPYQRTDENRGSVWRDSIQDGRLKAALFALSEMEKDCDGILDTLLPILKEVDSNGLSIVQNERLILFQTRIRQLKIELDVYRAEISKLGKWEVEARWMRQDLSNSRKDVISAETAMKGLKVRHAKELRMLEAELATQQNALAGFKLQTLSVERQTHKTQIHLESELKRLQTWNNLLLEELESLKMKRKSGNQLDSSSLRRQQQELEVGGGHQRSGHENDKEELIFALKTQEQSLKDAARRKRRTHLKEVEELQGRLHEQRKKHKRVMERMLEQWNRDVAGLKQDAIELEKKYRSNVVVLPSESEPRFRKEAQKPDLLRFEQILRCLEMSGI